MRSVTASLPAQLEHQAPKQKPRINKDELKLLASGRWPEIIASVCNVNVSVFDGCHHECPKCGGGPGADRFRMIDVDDGAVICNQCLPAGVGDGIATVRWLTGVSFPESLRLISNYVDGNHCDQSQVSQQRITAKKESKSKPADDAELNVRHRVFSTCCELFGLNDDHRDDLHRRGFTDDDIARNGYWSLTDDSILLLKLAKKYDHSEIVTAPGIFPGGALELSRTEGLVIPVRDCGGRIVAAQVRTYKKDSKARYVWLSSKFRGGPSPGTPVHVPLPIEGKAWSDSIPSITGTEGPLKADLFVARRKTLCVAIAGVNNFKRFADAIDWFKPNQFVIAFDADVATNKGVATAAVQLGQMISNSGIQPAAEVWNSKAKGVDDAIMADLPTKVLVGDDYVSWLEKIESLSDGSRRLQNYQWTKKEVDGETKNVQSPLPVSSIASDLFELKDGWPKVCQGAIFVLSDDGKSVRYLMNAQQLFGWIAAEAPADFSAKGGVSKTEFFEEIRQHAEHFVAVETVPHFPPIEGHFYVSKAGMGDGSHLEKLLDFFVTETEIDRQLIKALIVTTLWGGDPGQRPATGIDSTVGTGAGKSALAYRVASITGGFYECQPNTREEDFRKLLVNGDAHRISLIDNVRESRLSSAVLES